VAVDQPGDDSASSEVDQARGEGGEGLVFEDVGLAVPDVDDAAIYDADDAGGGVARVHGMDSAIVQEQRPAQAAVRVRAGDGIVAL